MTKLNLICPDDRITEVDVELDIEEIRVQEQEGHDKTINLDDNLRMDMKYPSLDQFIKSNFDVGNVDIEQSFELIGACVDRIYNEDEVWDAADVSKKEVIEFLEQMNSKQFKAIEKFFETMPKLTHTIQITNPKTKVKSPIVLEGLNSFFA